MELLSRHVMQHDQSRRKGRLQQKSGGATKHQPDLKHEICVHIARRSKTILIIVLFASVKVASRPLTQQVRHQ
jgi:hypothetical protein